MKIQYCRKLDKYVSVRHCEFFNGGKDCKYYSGTQWNRIEDLLADRHRPKPEVIGISKPYQCGLSG